MIYALGVWNGIGDIYPGIGGLAKLGWSMGRAYDRG
jgi:hypothetical protein